ncbi:MAG: hypothetical protein Q4B42_06955, partial [Oscillospiraceae bacterium]|nr:hypothetical protein [Oscillospiraceae bacterium]
VLTPLGSWGLNLLYGAQVAAQSGLLPLMVGCTVLTSLTLFYCMLLTVLRDMRGLIISTAAALAASFALSAPLINAYEMYGASLATLAALALECAALAAFGLAKLRPGEPQ